MINKYIFTIMIILVSYATKVPIIFCIKKYKTAKPKIYNLPIFVNKMASDPFLL